MSAFKARPAVFVVTPLQSFLFIIISLLTRFYCFQSRFFQLPSLLLGLVSAKIVGLNLFEWLLLP